MPSKGSLAGLNAPIFTGPSSPSAPGPWSGGGASGGGSATGCDSAAAASTGGGLGIGLDGGRGIGLEGGRDGTGGSGSSTSRSMSSKLGTGLLTPAFTGGGGGGGDTLDGGARSPSGASPVSSAMPKRSSASRRRAAPLPLRAATPGGRDAAEGPLAGRAREAAAGRDWALPTCAASSEERSIVLPGPGAGSAEATAPPGFRTWKTFLHEVQRTRTPRSVTFSSAIRNLDWHVGHCTTTIDHSRWSGARLTRNCPKKSGGALPS